jgi:CheY-like chemotaxis protein
LHHEARVGYGADGCDTNEVAQPPLPGIEGCRMKILFVDDDVFSSAALREGLAFSGYDVDFTVSADEAFRKIDEGNYDGLVTDLMMPSGTHLSSVEARGGFITGVYIAQASQKLYPEKPIFIYTGHKEVVGLSSTQLIIMQSNLDCTIIRKYAPIDKSLEIINSRMNGIRPSHKFGKLLDALKIEPNFMGVGIDVKKLLSILRKNDPQ